MGGTTGGTGGGGACSLCAFPVTGCSVTSRCACGSERPLTIGGKLCLSPNVAICLGTKWVCVHRQTNGCFDTCCDFPACHLGCTGLKCSQLPGPGVDRCPKAAAATAACCTTATCRKGCSGSKCVWIAGPGVSTCTTIGGSCTMTPPSLFPGSSRRSSSTGISRYSSAQSAQVGSLPATSRPCPYTKGCHLGCSLRRCRQLPGTGKNTCTSIDAPCGPSSTAGGILRNTIIPTLQQFFLPR